MTATPDTSTLPQVCVCYLTRVSAAGAPQVLLGRKKKGLGLGNLVGPGGKLEPGESVTDAMVREIHEESGLLVLPQDLVPMGLLTYLFPHRPAWSQMSSVFTASVWSGVPTESNELDPVWFDVATLPVDDMWDDARHWLPGVLAGTPVRATFTFAADLATVSAQH